MIGVRIFTSNLPEFNQYMDAVQKKALPYAMATAETRTAWLIVNQIKGVAKQRFDRPTPFAINSFRVDRAKKGTEATIWFKTRFDAAKTSDAERWMAPQVLGGPRRHKASEKLLISKGVMRSNEYFVPTSAAKLDSFGNVSRGLMVQILSQAGAFRETGYSMNSRRVKRGRARYVVNPTDLARGIWEVRQFGHGEGLRPILLFEEGAPKYRIRLPMFKIAENMAGKHMPEQFKSAFDAMVSRIRTEGLR